MRLQGAAPLGGNFGDGKGTSRLRSMLRASIKSVISSPMPPRPARMNGKAVMSALAPLLAESRELFAGVGESAGPRFVPVPSVLVLVPLGETAAVGDM